MCGKGHRHLSDLPKSKITDEWKFSVSESGFANSKVTLQVLQDLDAYLTRTQTQRWTASQATGVSRSLSSVRTAASTCCASSRTAPTSFR